MTSLKPRVFDFVLKKKLAFKLTCSTFFENFHQTLDLAYLLLSTQPIISVPNANENYPFILSRTFYGIQSKGWGTKVDWTKVDREGD